MYKLYGASAPWPFLKGLIRDNRPTWFFEETGIAYDRVSLDPMKGETRSPQYQKLNSFQKVPTLDHDGFVLSQSAAILHYLAASTGKLFPKDLKDQYRHLQWLFYCMSDVEAHATQMQTLLPMTDEKDHAHAKWMLDRAEKILARALDHLEFELKGKTFLMGSEFYACDILLGCCLYPVRDHKLVQDRPEIKRLLNSYYSRPAFKRMIEINGA